jgi:hypothetical protein
MRSQRRTRRLAVALIGSATLALTACGGGGSDDAAQPESASQEPSTPADSGADPFDLTRQAAAHMPMTADALATGFDSALKLPGNADSDAAGLRAQLTYLLTEHVYLAGIAVDTAYVAGADSREFKQAAKTLDANSVALSDAVGSVAGDKKAATFLAAWRSHIKDFVSYAVAAKEGDQAGKRAALHNLAAYQRTAGKFFADITGGALPASAVRASLGEHVATLTAAIDAFAAGNTDAFDKLKVAADHMPMTAMALADGIDQAANIAGNPDDQASELRAALNAKLTEHVYLSGIGVFTAYVDGADSKSFNAAAGTIDDNSVEIADAVAGLTDQKTGDSFLQSWRSHINDFVAYAVAVANGDQQGEQKAQANLEGYAKASGMTFEQLTGGALTATAVQHEFEMHIESLSNAIDALASTLIR